MADEFDTTEQPVQGAGPQESSGATSENAGTSSGTGQSQRSEQNQHSEHKAHTEEFKVSGESLLNKIKELIREGNIRRIIIKNDDGKTLVELPLAIGLVGAAFAPVLAAVGAIAALVTNCTIVVERRE